MSHCILWWRLPRQRLSLNSFLKPGHKSRACPQARCVPQATHVWFECLVITWFWSARLRWWKGRFFQEGHWWPCHPWLEQLGQCLNRYHCGLHSVLLGALSVDLEIPLPHSLFLPLWRGIPRYVTVGEHHPSCLWLQFAAGFWSRAAVNGSE